ncbi:hypothetical protein [Nocardioides limicola]|uniref:hypothetical protein n=1 Tax=Nocardioides limicola TaxID=2803368 RepID=UPI00193B4A51|nr:hypothetical protein [Nocardioides sp. DJM-14]
MSHTVRKTELFGIGTKYEIAGGSHRLAVLELKDGNFEIYELEAGASEPTAVIRLDEQEARRAAAILSGSFFSE